MPSWGQPARRRGGKRRRTPQSCNDLPGSSGNGSAGEEQGRLRGSGSHGEYRGQPVGAQADFSALGASGAAGGKDARRGPGLRRLGTNVGASGPDHVGADAAGQKWRWQALMALREGRAARGWSLLEKLAEMALAEAPLVEAALAAPTLPGTRLHLAEAARAASEGDQGGAAAG
jgi:hypothetical protein